jgi:hypothetical protein
VFREGSRIPQRLQEKKAIRDAQHAQAESKVEAPAEANIPPPAEPSSGQLIQGRAARSTVREWQRSSGVKTVEDLYINAERNQNALVSESEKIAREHQSEFVNPGVKERAPRVDEKLGQGTMPREITDIVRGAFDVRSPAQADAIASSLAKRFQVADRGSARISHRIP